jgi:hypothetical protein
MKFDIDKKVFSVDQNLASAGGSATEVLQNIPSVEQTETLISLDEAIERQVWVKEYPSSKPASAKKR